MKRREFKPKEKPEFEQKLLNIARVARVIAGGRRFRFRAVVVVGNRKGKVGIGVAKGADVTGAVEKAQKKAQKALITVPLVKGSIPHQIKIKLNAAKLLLKPGRVGQGIVAGGVLRSIFELAGIEDISAKILGSNNQMNNAKAAIEALKRLKTLNGEQETKNSAKHETSPTKT